jgi:hypothetical protein
MTLGVVVAALVIGMQWWKKEIFGERKGPKS